MSYYKGQANLQAGELILARKAFTQILELNIGPWIEKTQGQIKRIQEIERGTPGSTRGKQIALKEQITRAELAILLLEEFKFILISPTTSA